MPTFENPGFQECPPSHVDPPKTTEDSGVQNAGQTTTVTMIQPGSSDVTMEVEKPRDYFTLSILACIFCSRIVGVCAIHNNCKTRQMIRKGRMTEAIVYSSIVKKLLIWSFALGLISLANIAIFYFVIKPIMHNEQIDMARDLRSSY